MRIADVMAAAAVAEAKPQAALEDQITTVYGDKGVGKSTFASRYPAPVFFDFEDRLRNITLPSGKRPAQLQFEDWQDVLDVTAALKTSTPKDTKWRTIVIDGGAMAWELMLRKLLKDNEVESWNDGALGYMKGRDIAVKRWSEWFHDLRSLTQRGYGVVITAHETTQPFEFNGVKVDKRVPLISGVSGGIEWGWQAMRPSIDMVIHVSKKEIDGKPAHIMRVKGNQLIEASDPTPDGRLPVETVFSFKTLKQFWDGTTKAEAPAEAATTTEKEA